MKKLKSNFNLEKEYWFLTVLVVAVDFDFQIHHRLRSDVNFNV